MWSDLFLYDHNHYSSQEKTNLITEGWKDTVATCFLPRRTHTVYRALRIADLVVVKFSLSLQLEKRALFTLNLKIDNGSVHRLTAAFSYCNQGRKEMANLTQQLPKQTVQKEPRTKKKT